MRKRKTKRRNTKPTHYSMPCCNAFASGVLINWSDGKRKFLSWESVGLQTERKRFRGETVEYEKDKYTRIQNLHYKRVVYGLSSIPMEELRKMSEQETRAIKKKYMSAKIELNRLKNEVLDSIFEREIPSVFKERTCSTVVKALKDRYEDCYDEPNYLTFSFLGITREMIIDRLVRVGILDRAVFNL